MVCEPLGAVELLAFSMSSSWVVAGLPLIVQPEPAPRPVGWLASVADAFEKPVGALQVPSASSHICMPTDWTAVEVLPTVNVNVYVVVAFEVLGLDELKVSVRFVMVTIAYAPNAGNAANTTPASNTKASRKKRVCFGLTVMPEY
jgi:hypothetical protein